MKASLTLLRFGLAELAFGAGLAAFSPTDVWPPAVMITGVICCCTSVVLKELGR